MWQHPDEACLFLWLDSMPTHAHRRGLRAAVAGHAAHLRIARSADARTTMLCPSWATVPLPPECALASDGGAKPKPKAGLSPCRRPKPWPLRVCRRRCVLRTRPGRAQRMSWNIARPSNQFGIHQKRVDTSVVV